MTSPVICIDRTVSINLSHMLTSIDSKKTWSEEIRKERDRSLQITINSLQRRPCLHISPRSILCAFYSRHQYANSLPALMNLRRFSEGMYFSHMLVELALKYSAKNYVLILLRRILYPRFQETTTTDHALGYLTTFQWRFRSHSDHCLVRPRTARSISFSLFRTEKKASIESLLRRDETRTRTVRKMMKAEGKRDMCAYCWNQREKHSDEAGEESETCLCSLPCMNQYRRYGRKETDTDDERWNKNE